ncbi:N-glycosylase/DNA lyase [Candidatus Woesearchaeota archaeon]|nr:N-glycosylase/DNA lyase [Candidatus Woesearchaeota archaeon]
MRGLLKEIDKVKESSVQKKINSRIKEFKSLRRKKSQDIFKELCFCILTANSNAERCIDVHCNVGDGFLNLSRAKLKNKLKECGARFHTKRAGYIYESRRYKDTLKDVLKHFKDEHKRREWLVKNVKGIGYKEASHFLRNIGYSNYAIIDFHIIDVLAKYRVIKRPQKLNKKSYFRIEKKLKDVAEKVKLNLDELDLYLWYLETGKVLK